MLWTIQPGGVQWWDDGDIHATILPLSPNGHAEWCVVCTDKLVPLPFSGGLDLFPELEECRGGVEVSIEKAKAAAERAIASIKGDE
jgi:hypothetical protein